MRKFCLLFIVISIIFSIALAVISENSMTPLLTMSSAISANPRVEHHSDLTYSHYYDIEANNFNDLATSSDYILKIKPITEGTQRAYSTLRECIVVSAYKGTINEKTIYVYEPNYFNPFSSFTCLGGYINMHMNQEYIVFLNKITQDEYPLNSEISNGYTFTNSSFSKYSLSSAPATVQNFNQEVYYRDIINLPFSSDSEEKVNMFNTILDQVIKVYSQ